MNKKNKIDRSNKWIRPLLVGSLIAPLGVYAQSDTPEEEEVYELSPFEVSSTENIGYRATSTLAGTRLRMELKDSGSAIQAITEEMMDDIGATDNQTLLQYTTNTEVGGVSGNFAGLGNGTSLNEQTAHRSPNQNTRVRGLTSADNARDFFQTVIPWDGYNTERIDIQRGANSILFGLGSPAGIINADLRDANYYNDSGELGLRLGEHGSYRTTLDYNKVLIEDELAIRLSLLNEEEKYKQKPAFEKDERFYVALRYEPSFLKSDRSRSIFKVKYESGDISRNAPRVLPPSDMITPWFDADKLDKIAVVPQHADDQGTKLPGRGVYYAEYDDGMPNPYYNPWVHDFPQTFGGALVIFDDPTTDVITGVIKTELVNTHGGLAPDGSLDATIEGLQNGRLKGVGRFSNVSKGLGLENASFGQYQDLVLSDPSIFDFYNNLLDGPNKGTTAEFDALNIAFEQTFFDDSVGFDLTYDKQSYEDEQLTLFASWKSALNVDINSHYPDGRVNPNFGRPFVNDSQVGNGATSVTEDETIRASGYWNIDFEEQFDSSGFVAKLLGVQTLNVAHTEYSRENDSRSFQRYGTGADYDLFLKGTTGNAIDPNHDDNHRQLVVVNYLGDSLRDANTASGANIPRLTSVHTPTSGTIYAFDSTWNSTVNPSDPWTNPWDGAVLTQSENPANYVGYREVPFTVLDASNEEDRSKLTYRGALSSVEVDSDVFVWSGRMFGGAINPMFAYREDTATLKNYLAPNNGPDGVTNFEDYNLNNPAGSNLVYKGEQKSKGIVAHLDQRLGIDGLPFELSVFYNESENFNPGSQRVDVFGNPLAPPTGETKDYGFIVSSKDQKLSARVTFYESKMKNATNDAISGAAFWLGLIENWNLNNAIIIRDMPSGHSDWEFLSQNEGESDEDFLQRRIDFTQVVFDNQLSREFYDAWNIGDPEVDIQPFLDRRQTVQTPQGLTATSDLLSEGIEIEIVAQPTENWNIAFNAAKSEATFSNVGGALAEWIESRKADYDNVVNGRRFGDQVLWGTGGTDTIENRLNTEFYGTYALMLLNEGAPTPEVREWRANLITNYSFSEGKLKGAYAGMGIRWQDDVGIGYGLTTDADGDTIFDKNQERRAPSETNFDFWMGYTKALSDRVDWKIQLNIGNAFSGDELIPITTQPDGSVAAARIAPSRNFRLQNTFSF